MEGFSAAGYGEAWVSLSIRGVQAAGFDSFCCSYDYQQFSKRMVVSRGANGGRPSPTSVSVLGFGCGCVGIPSTRNKAQYIRPDGNSDQHRKGVIQ